MKELSSIPVVLGGGGIKGFGHIGVLTAAEELQVPVGLMTGVSVGSIVCALYKNNYSPAQLTDLFLKKLASRHQSMVWWRSIPGLDCLTALSGWLPDLVPAMQNLVTELKLKPHPDLQIVAYDMIRRRPHVFWGADYDLGLALSATCALPGVFRPVYDRQSKSLLVDGALYHRNPCEFSGASKAIVSKLGFARQLPKEPIPPWELWWHLREMYGLSHQERHEVDCQKHLVIELDTPDISGLSFSRSRETCLWMVENGYKTAINQLVMAKQDDKLFF